MGCCEVISKAQKGSFWRLCCQLKDCVSETPLCAALLSGVRHNLPCNLQACRSLGKMLAIPCGRQ